LKDTSRHLLSELSMAFLELIENFKIWFTIKELHFLIIMEGIYYTLTKAVYKFDLTPLISCVDRRECIWSFIDNN